MNGARPQVRMYTTAFCPYCQRAERLLAARGVAEIEKIRVDLEPAQRVEMVQKTGRRTVPQIYIGEQHVGGFDDIAELDREGRLEPMLRGDAVTAPDNQNSIHSPKAPS